jgi:hypothetical protein
MEEPIIVLITVVSLVLVVLVNLLASINNSKNNGDKS